MVRSILLTMIVALSALAGGGSRLPPLPDKEGFAGLFAGVSGGALIVAGGANFPDKKPWEGGTKVWYDSVFVLDRPAGEWKIAGRLPRRLGYGVSVTQGGGVICVGGSDAAGHYPDAFRMVWKDGKLLTTPLPALPKPLAQTCGAMVGDVLYIAGGLEKPDATEASKRVFAIDLAATKPAWREIEPCPGVGRILPVGAAYDGAFWMVGGAELSVGADGKAQRRYLKDGYRYDAGRGWKPIADLPYAVAAAPSPAPSDGQGFYVMGGDDGAQVGASPQQHRGFGRAVLRYDGKTDRWEKAGEFPAGAVTAPAVWWKDAWVIPSGEVRPGVRSPDVWRWAPQKGE